MSQLNEIIPPEIKGDEFYFFIQRLAREEQLKHVLEIGSSAGGGSTEAFVLGLQANPLKPSLYCLEVSKTRFEQLRDRYKSHSFVKAYNASSVPISTFMSEAEVRDFYTSTSTNLNTYPLEKILGWLKQDIDYVSSAGSPQNGIESIKREHNLSSFDLVLIDGSAFTGMAELDAVYGSKIILLDDINDIKCLKPYERLKRDPNYRLEHENWALRNGFAVFRRRDSIQPQATENLPIHFFTIVLNGEPFIRYHIEAFRQLDIPWEWHIVEGVAELKHDTAWSLENGGRIVAELHKDGLSKDGTSEYLDQLAKEYPGKIHIYRKPPGQFWDGKLEMVSAPLSKLNSQALLIQVDADELWTTEQIESMHKMFKGNPERYAAYFYTRYFVGPDLVTTSLNTYGNNTSYEWLRAWRYIPGCRWAAHEPPRLCAQTTDGKWVDLAQLNPFTHSETESLGLVFQHFAYTTKEQLAFKEHYYGYKSAIAEWGKLQTQTTFPVQLKDYFSWVKDQAVVDRYQTFNFKTLARQTLDGSWHFNPRVRRESYPREVVLIRTDAIGDNVLSSAMLPYLAKHYAGAKITMLCQDSVAELYKFSPFVDRVISFNKQKLNADPVELEQFIGKIRTLKADVAINLVWSSEILTHLLTLSLGARVTIGHFGNLSNIREEDRAKASQMYSVVVQSEGEERSELEHHSDLLRALGINDFELAPTIQIDDQTKERAESKLREAGINPERAIAFFPGADPSLAQRNYPHFKEVLAAVCIQEGLSVIALGGGREAALAAAALNIPGLKSVNLCGHTSLLEAAAIIKSCKAALGVDTGLSHIACAVGTPNTVVMGGGHFGRFFPYSALTSIAFLPLQCFGCGWRCGFQKAHCVQDLSAGTVVEALRTTLSKASSLPRYFYQKQEEYQGGVGLPAWEYNLEVGQAFDEQRMEDPSSNSERREEVLSLLW